MCLQVAQVCKIEDMTIWTGIMILVSWLTSLVCSMVSKFLVLQRLKVLRLFWVEPTIRAMEMLGKHVALKNLEIHLDGLCDEVLWTLFRLPQIQELRLHTQNTDVGLSSEPLESWVLFFGEEANSMSLLYLKLLIPRQDCKSTAETLVPYFMGHS